MNAVTRTVTGQAVETNQRGLLATICFMTQLAPSSLWAEALYSSGFFNHVVKVLREDEVYCATRQSTADLIVPL